MQEYFLEIFSLDAADPNMWTLAAKTWKNIPPLSLHFYKMWMLSSFAFC